MTDTPLTVRSLWKTMTPAQRTAAAEAFWSDDEAADDQVQAVMLISQQKKFRPKSVIALDIARKARHFASIMNLPDGLAARALILHHLTNQRPMMAAFLDELGVTHEEGLIQEDSAKPDPAKMKAAVEKITAQFPAEDVTLYLNTLLVQDPETWGALSEIVNQPKL